MRKWRHLPLALLLVLVLAANAGANLRKVAVIDFDDRSGAKLEGIGGVAGELVAVGLAKSGFFEVVERNKLAQIMEEHTLTISGLVDSEKNLLTLGKLLNADAIVTGSILEFSENRMTTTAYGVTTNKATYHMEVSVKELDVNTSKVAFADIFTADHSQVLAGNAQSANSGIDRQLLKTALSKAIDQMVALELVKGQQTPSIVEVMVSIASDPMGADVVVDGAYYGSTPLDLPIKEGIHVIKVSRGGYLPWENQVKVYQGMKPILVSLAPVPPPSK